MSSAAKGMAGLVVALALIAGVAFWILKDDSGSGLLSPGGRKTASHDAAPLPAAETSKSEAQRAAEAKPTLPAPETVEPALPAGTPVADFLAGVVVDHDGQPVANAEISFAAASIGPRTRGGRSLRIRPPLVKEGPEIPATLGKTGADGSFKLVHVPREEGFDLTVDHPDYVYLRKSGIVLPSKGLDVGRITLEAGGAVSGTVYGPGGAKLASAEVWLDDAPDANNNNGFFPFRMFGFGQTRGERKATTDDQGRFRLAGMPPGKCVVVAKSSECPEGESGAIELKAHEEVGNIDVTLEHGDKITGTVKGPDGKPVAAAEIHVNNAASGQGRGMNLRFTGRRNPFEPDTATDAGGHFEVKALKHGNYNVSVDAKGFAVKNVDGVDSSATAPLEIALAAGTHLAGTVHIKDSPELPKNVKVQLTPVWGDTPPPPSLDFPDSDNVATQDGAFVIADVEPGKYRVVARGDDTTRGTSETIEVVDGQNLDNVEVTVERGALVVGKVVDAATGAPVAGADVQAETIPQDDGNGSNSRRVNVQIFGGPRAARRFVGNGQRATVGRAKSDAEGKYELKGLPAGQFTIDARHADYAALRSAPIDVKTAEAKDNVDLRLLRGGTIEGTVTGLDGKPRSGDRIDVTSTTIEGVTLNALTDANGGYRVEHVPAGDGTVTRAEPDTGAPGRPVFRMAFAGAGGQEDAGKPFTMKEGDLVRIDFAQQEKPWVEGVVRSVEGPVAGAIVQALADNGGRRGGFFGGDQKMATTGADGGYRIADLDPGSYRISVRHPQGIVPVQQPVELKTGEPVRQDFFLEGGVIEGSVGVQKNHAALEGALVTIEKVKDDAAAQDPTQAVFTSLAISVAPGGGGRGRRGGMQSYTFGGDMGRQQVMTDATGHFRVPWVPSGKWRVSASHTGYLSAQSDPVELAANAKVEGVRLELPPAAQLIVHLKSKGTGMPMAGAPVELSTEEGGHEFRMTDEDGAATFESLKPGTWTVSGRKGFNNSNDAVKKTVEAPADRTTEVTIDA
jgi:protocatechuate 3,4-dioxygenase beta subunit